MRLVVSDEGYGRNDYIETTRSLVVVTAPGPGSGKMATCLSQLYHDGLMEATPVEQTAVFQAAEQFAAKREILPIQTGGEMRNLTVDEILYLESDKHTVRIYMLSSSAGPYSCYASLQSFEEKLQPLGFLRVQKSFLVNMRHIRKLQCGEAALESGETLPVSEKNYRQIKRAYLLWKGAQTWST